MATATSTRADYLQFWQTSQPVFWREVGVAHMFIPQALEGRLNRLVALCQQPQALLIISGDSGTGKSTLLKWLYHTLNVSTHEVFLTTLVRAEKQSGWLTPRLAAFMGISLGDQAFDLADAIRRTAASFDDLLLKQRQLLVAMDAAHLIDTVEAYGEITAFLNLQALAGACLTFLLAGDSRLRTLLAQVPELAGRATFTLTLAPLNQTETSNYLAHRLASAGVDGEFTADAAELIYTHSHGILSRINNLGENCLLEAASRGQRLCTRDSVLIAIEQITGGLRQGREVSQSTWRPDAAPLAALDTFTTPSIRDDRNERSLEAVPLAAAESKSDAAATVAAPSKPAPSAEGAGIKLTSLFKSEPERKRS